MKKKKVARGIKKIHPTKEQTAERWKFVAQNDLLKGKPRHKTDRQIADWYGVCTATICYDRQFNQASEK